MLKRKSLTDNDLQLVCRKWVGRSLTQPVRCVGLIVHGREKLSREGLRKMRREGANEAILARSTDHVAPFLVPSQSQNTRNLGPVTLLLLRQQGKKTYSTPVHQPRTTPPELVRASDFSPSYRNQRRRIKPIDVLPGKQSALPGDKKRRACSITRTGSFCNPAASYFPTASQQQYHRPWRA